MTMLPSYEIWSWIPRYEGRYEISNRGRIRSWVGRKNGITPLIRREHQNKFGYVAINIGSIAKGNRKGIRLHRAVGLLYVYNPDPKNKDEVNHVNGDKYCNEWWNLEWATRHENIQHAFKNKLIVPAVGEKQSNTKLTRSEVLEIFYSGLSYSTLGLRYGVGADTICSIKIGRTWSHVTGKERNPKVQKVSKKRILEVYNFNGSTREASEHFKMSFSFCFAVKTGRKYANITGQKKLITKCKTQIKPTPEVVVSIFGSKESTKILAAKYNCSDSFIKNVRSGRRFSEITNNL